MRRLVPLPVRNYCGATVNPDRVRAQMEGACVMGVGLATLGEITFKNGRVEQDNFNAYEVTRMSGAPREIRVHIIPGDYDRPMGGVGEPGVPPIPPRCATRSSRRRASASGVCPSAISSRHEAAYLAAAVASTAGLVARRP